MDQPMESDEVFNNNEENNIIINAVDGLPDVHSNYNEFQTEKKDRKTVSEGARTLEEIIHDEDLPTSLIVTNIDSSVFQSEEAKEKIQVLFSQFGEPESIQFFRSFRRMRVNYKCPATAAKARIQLHQASFGDKKINCYFAQPVSPIDLEDQHLHPPALTKQFLISPPASPPVGWEPRDETEPLVNYDLLAAIANLTPGEAHELHPPQGGQPGIVVHVCEETAPTVNPRIIHTRCPQQN
ncbi:hypothetical protein RUM43_010303 [Polyplax serrata]|uniref:Protein sarah n=1 Tax=Polyplax serrata TaxID=468196 RepID=A0AAN8S762_POLSC